jgi:hypothetical protein
MIVPGGWVEKPKSAHSWREPVSEIGVIDILIARTAEQIVEAKT